MSHVPNQPKTPVRAIRVDDELWAALQAKAKENGETVSEFLRRLMSEAVRR